MVRNQQNQKWPAVLYLTPDMWSPLAEVHAVDRRELRRMIAELRKLGEDWRHVSEDEATQYSLSEVRGDDYAVYERRVRGGVDRIVVRRRHLPSGAWYEWGPYEGSGNGH